MAAEIHKFCLSETPFSGDTRLRSVEWILEGQQLTDALVYQWLENEDPQVSGTPSFIEGGTIERPDGTIYTGAASGTPVDWTAGEGPVLFTHDDRRISNIRYLHERDKDPEIYRVTVDYEAVANAPAGEFSIGFDIGPDVEVLRYALSTINTYNPTGGTAPNVNQAINVQFDGTVDGVQIPGAVMLLTMSFTQAASWFTAAKLKAWMNARGLVNSDVVTINGLIFQAGELRFVGVSGGVSNTGDSTLEVRFGYSQNQTGITISGITGLIAKQGWDYLWVFYGPGEEAGRPSSVPRGAYVQRLLSQTVFTSLFF